jgi:hypothetical protein
VLPIIYAKNTHEGMKVLLFHNSSVISAKGERREYLSTLQAFMKVIQRVIFIVK